MALLGVDDQMKSAVSVIAVGVVGVHPDALIRLVTSEATAQCHTDLARGLRSDAWPADACDVDALAHVASENDLVLTWGKMSHARDIPSAHEGAVSFDNCEERTEAAALHAISGRIVRQSRVKRKRLLRGLCVRSVVCIRHLKPLSFASLDTARLIAPSSSELWQL
jgi:hypothetical protein